VRSNFIKASKRKVAINGIQKDQINENSIIQAQQNNPGKRQNIIIEQNQLIGNINIVPTQLQNNKISINEL